MIPLTVTPGSIATQKGDVYSFAIILEEIVIRGGPYDIARTYMSSQEVDYHCFNFLFQNVCFRINVLLVLVKKDTFEENHG